MKNIDTYDVKIINHAVQAGKKRLAKAEESGNKDEINRRKGELELLLLIEKA